MRPSAAPPTIDGETLRLLDQSPQRGRPLNGPLLDYLPEGERRRFLGALRTVIACQWKEIFDWWRPAQSRPELLRQRLEEDLVRERGRARERGDADEVARLTRWLGVLGEHDAAAHAICAQVLVQAAVGTGKVGS